MRFVIRAPGTGLHAAGAKLDPGAGLEKAAAGYPLRAAAEARLAGTLGDAKTPATSSMYRDLLAGLPLESDQIIGDLVRRAEGLGVDVPLLRLADTSLAVYGAAR